MRKIVPKRIRKDVVKACTIGNVSKIIDDATAKSNCGISKSLCKYDLSQHHFQNVIAKEQTKYTCQNITKYIQNITNYIFESLRQMELFFFLK